MNELVLLIKKGANRTLCYAIMLGCFLGVQYRSLTARLDAIEARLENLERAVNHRSVSARATNTVSIGQHTFRSELSPDGYGLIWGMFDWQPWGNAPNVEIPVRRGTRVSIWTTSFASSYGAALFTGSFTTGKYQLLDEGRLWIEAPLQFDAAAVASTTETGGWQGATSAEDGLSIVWGGQALVQRSDWTVGVPTYTADNYRITYDWSYLASTRTILATSNVLYADTALKTKWFRAHVFRITGATVQARISRQIIPDIWDVPCNRIRIMPSVSARWGLNTSITNQFAFGAYFIQVEPA